MPVGRTERVPEAGCLSLARRNLSPRPRSADRHMRSLTVMDTTNLPGIEVPSHEAIRRLECCGSRSALAAGVREDTD